MPNKKNFQIHPYLYYLSRRMVEYDFVGLGKPPNNHELACYIYERYNTKKGTKFTDHSDVRDPLAASIAENTHKYVLKPKDFRFSLNRLNDWVKEIRTLGSFSSWKDFRIVLHDNFDGDLDTVNEMRSTGSFIYDEISNNEFSFSKAKEDYYLSYANQRLFDFHTIFTLRDMPNDHWIVLPKPVDLINRTRPNNLWLITRRPDFIIRTANKNELEQIAKSYVVHYPLTTLNRHHLFRLYEKNKNICFVYKTEDNRLMGWFFLIPVTQDYYAEIKEGRYNKEVPHITDICSYDGKDVAYFRLMACSWNIPKVGIQIKKALCEIIEQLSNLHKKIYLGMVGKPYLHITKYIHLSLTDATRTPGHYDFHELTELSLTKMRQTSDNNWGFEKTEFFSLD